MHIELDFESAGIDVVDATDPSAIRLMIRSDNASDFRQWFCFRVRGAQGISLGLCIENAGDASLPEGWLGYRVLASYNGEHWFHVPTGFDGHSLTITHTPGDELVTYAYHAPYPSDRLDSLLAEAEASSRAEVLELGRSVEGRSIWRLAFGASRDKDEQDRLRLWVIAHQHPGETMSAYCAEGLIQRLLDENDAAARALLERAAVFIVPRMNPDGCALGNHRTNAAGRDLNREWLGANPETSPEVFWVRETIAEIGVDMFVDIHGDEILPYVFAFGTEGNPDRSPRVAWLEDRFCEALNHASADFQREHGYDPDPPGEADLRMATEYIANRFDCLSMGLEMPFKDNEHRPGSPDGWTPDRSRALGRSLLEAMLGCVDLLR